MTEHTFTSFTAVTVVSPACMGEETKNQDRAHWFGPGLSASLCDGVTSSPEADDGAQLVTELSPVLFKVPPEEALRFIAHLLVTYRVTAQHQPLSTRGSKPPEMQRMLQEVIRQRRAESYQTTLVALNLVPTDEYVTARMVWCGDSVTCPHFMYQWL